MYTKEIAKKIKKKLLTQTESSEPVKVYTTDTPIPEKNKNAAFSARHAVSGGQN